MSRCTMQTEKVINHILEIIYLMTGEEYMIVKKPVPYKLIPQVSGDLCQTRNSIVEIPTDSPIHLRGNSGSYPSNQLNHGLTRNVENKFLDSVFQSSTGGGHVQIKCDDIAMYLSVEEWDYLEKHKEQFKGTTVNKQPLHDSSDGNNILDIALTPDTVGLQSTVGSDSSVANLLHNAHILDRSYTPLCSQGEGKTPLNSQDEAQTSLGPQGGTQTPLKSQGEAQSLLGSQYGPQTPLYSQGGAQNPLGSQYGAQTPHSSQGETQSPLNSQSGGQTPILSRYGPQTPLGSQGGPLTPLGTQDGPQTSLGSQDGPQTPLGSQDGPQTPLGSQDGPQTPFGSQYGPQNPLVSQYGPKIPLSSQYGPQNSLGSQYGPQNPLGSQYAPQNPLGSQYGPQNPLGSQYGPQNPLGSQYGPQNPLGSQFGPQNPLGSQFGPQNPLGSQYGPQNPLGSQYGPQNPLGSQYGPQNPLGSQFGSQNPLCSQFGPQNPLGSQVRPQNPLGSKYGPQNPFVSQYGAQTLLFSQNGAQGPVCSQNSLNQGHTEYWNGDENYPDTKVRTPGTINTHLCSIGKSNATNLMLSCLSKCDVDTNKFVLNRFTTNICSSNPSPELPQLNASPDVTTCVKEEHTLADGSCMGNLRDGHHSQFSKFDQDQGQKSINKYLGGPSGLENMEKNKDMAWNITSAVTEAGGKALTPNRECSGVEESPESMTIEPKDTVLGHNKDVTALLNNHTLNYDPFTGIFLETRIKKELTNSECSDTEGDHQNMMVEVNDAMLSLHKDSPALVNSPSLNCSPNPHADIPRLTQIKNEPSTHLGYQHFAKKPARRFQNGTLQGAARSRSCGRSSKVVSCPECGKLFSCNAYLMRHRRIHTGEKPYTCSECGRSFSWMSSLSTHKRTHTGEKPFFCKECGNRFSDYSGIIKHQRIHTGEKPYSCVMCGERFAQTYQLVKHQSVHSVENVAENTLT
ncbi:uncharacterized protein LOC142102112 isoform X2 [Mixophyes fleayi]|uniref:uncharacterized protein LOC142102112 isoform X2 n=1 Tax=Mixophyes fleayi TaxID=3061075 RepID=UPI003F4D8AA7